MKLWGREVRRGGLFALEGDRETAKNLDFDEEKLWLEKEVKIWLF